MLSPINYLFFRIADSFYRRTPLHGMLSASELLREDMHQAFVQPAEADPFDAVQRPGPRPETRTEVTEDRTHLRRMTALLDMIDQAGKFHCICDGCLLTFITGEKLTLSINSLIDFDSLTDAVEVEPKRELCLLEELEAEVCCTSAIHRQKPLAYCFPCSRHHVKRPSGPIGQDRIHPG